MRQSYDNRCAGLHKFLIRACLELLCEFTIGKILTSTQTRRRIDAG